MARVKKKAGSNPDRIEDTKTPKRRRTGSRSVCSRGWKPALLLSESNARYLPNSEKEYRRKGGDGERERKGRAL